MSKEIQSIFYFKNAKHTFEATVKENVSTITIAIGGLTFKNCINVSIRKDPITHNPFALSIIPYIQSEPECGFSNMLDKGDTVDFIKASLQFVNKLYPTVTSFKFDDGSNVECGIYKTNKPPRKMEKPFSLAHLYIANYGKTWYEKQFNAKMLNEKMFNQYRNTMTVMDEKITTSYNNFKEWNFISDKQDKYLKQYYSLDKTWKEFFNAIPIKDRCVALFNWLPTFINELCDNVYNPNGWYIDINTMPKTIMNIIDNPIIGGNILDKTDKTDKTDKIRTRKVRNNKIIFSNSMPSSFMSGGGIFDGV